jgi:NAD(P)-dependent dehydrogenase (short-subunit alcohol dehydrogenase family)
LSSASSRRFDRLDMAFNNAGIMIPPSDAADETAGNFDRVNAIDLRGVWACMKHELRQMRDQESGAIVNCSSLGGLVGPIRRLVQIESAASNIDPFSIRKNSPPPTSLSCVVRTDNSARVRDGYSR